MKLSPSMFIGNQSNDTISLGSGQPDLPPPKEMYEGLEFRSDLRYGVVQGEQILREKLSNEYPDSKPDNFVITNGASEALDLTFRNMAPGKVILGKPYYYSYPEMLKFAGMEAVFTEMNDGRIDIDDFSEKVHDCKAVLINSPSNPTGRVESIKTLKEIEKITRDLGVAIVSDEVYKDLIYERENYFLKGPHVVTINSFSKTYAMCGARVGYLWSNNQEFVDKVIGMKTHTSMNTSLIGQDMAVRAMNAPKSFVTDQMKIWKERRDLIYKRLNGMGLDLWKPEGAFYAFPKVDNPNKTVLDLYQKHKVITYLGEWFGDASRIRLSYANSVENINKAMDIMEKYLAKN